VSDADWQRILTSGHWDCLGWSIDSNGALVCACKAVIREPTEVTA
jgi:hypothetical protein